ncbi:putative aspartyl protease [Rhodopseudomonas rhenobacensis]|uniref:Putative aspartyl protease n=1 Tax=Rhodopseudomonas rhenobacensis TaxID=87461 RepID=A0A7W7Z4Q8_9BRAD|nr:PepSY domain-containing protein [Rhodopseudomonas rhenobacensis]MBB5047803.1 putative aspartyl protease [Rhodopseudomonas rhenobacensis]
MNRIVATMVAGLIAAGAATAARADQPGADWMPAEQVRQKLMQAGYSQITQLKADDGHWEGEGVKNGQKMDFHADPKTGAITKEKPDD